MVTINDVAREAEASISTVSKALNNSYAISPERAEHIKAVAKRLGYKPNIRAQALSRKSSRKIVFLTRLGKNMAFENPHMFEILSGVESALREKNYGIILLHCDEKNICAASKDIIQSKGADGLILHASVVTKELSVMLSRENVPHIVIGKPDFLNSLSWIDNNNRLAGGMAARRLLELGHKNIAIIGSPKGDNISEDRISGASAEFNSRDDIHPVVLRGESTIEHGRQLGERILALEPRPTAIICAGNHLAVGCLRALQLNKVAVPDDISLITFDEYPFSKFTDPPLSTVNIDVHDLGVHAAKMLLGIIKQPKLHVQSYSTLPVLVERGSCARVASHHS